MSQYLTIFNKETSIVGEIPAEEMAMSFPYELDSFQKEGIYRIYNNENILITAHTGSGKTVLALYAIADCFRKNKKVIYTSPTKSLSNQKYAEFVEKFGDKNKIGILTGDMKMNPDAPCLIMTTEILRNTLYRESMRERGLLSADIMNFSLRVEEIGAVVFDEVHYINDPDRGRVWEEVFILLPREVNLVLLSATIDRPDEFASWLGDLKEKSIHLIPTSHRVVPLRHYFWDNRREEMTPVLMEDGVFKNYDKIRSGYERCDMNRIMNRVIDNLKENDLLPVLFFTFSRKKCEKLCQSVQGIQLLDHIQQREVEKIFNFYMHPYKDNYELIPQYQDIYNWMRRGVAYHHSGLIPILKEIVEIIFAKGLIKVLFATETFAVGVNMPTKTVVFSELEKYDNNGRRYLRTDEYLQMSGRAGRRGLDAVGTVILLPTMDLPEQTELRKMMTGKSPCISSRFKLTYQFILKTMVNSEVNTDIFLNKTLKRNEDNKIIHVLERDYERKRIEVEERERNLGINEEMEDKVKKYIKNREKLEDRFIVVKGKDRKKLENEQKEYEKINNWKRIVDEYGDYEKDKRELNRMEEDRRHYKTFLEIETDKMKKFLEDELYIENDQLLERGLTAVGIGEIDEILLTELIYNNMFDDKNMEEMVTILSIFIDEGEIENDIYIDELNIPFKVKNTYKWLKVKAEELSQKEAGYGISIHTSYYYEECLKMGLLEATHMWVSGCDIRELHQTTEIYAGNFCRAMMRLQQICETLIKILTNMGKYEIVQKFEGYQLKLLRDFTTVQSLYVR